MPESHDRRDPEKLHKKAAESREFRLLDQDDAAFFLKTFAGRASFETCVAAMRVRGYRDADIPVLIMKFGNDILRDAVLDRIDEYPDADVAELFHATLLMGGGYQKIVIKYIAERIETFAMQPGFAERILGTEVLGTEKGVELLVLNLSHMRNVSRGVAQRLIGKKMYWAVLGHLSSFEPDAVDVPALIAEMQLKNEVQEDVAQKLLDAVDDPGLFATLIVRERCVLLNAFRRTGENVEKNDDNRSSHEARRRALFFQALPDKALLASYQRSLGEHAVHEVMFRIHEMGMTPGLAHDLPEIMQDLFGMSEQDFFAQANRSLLRAQLESARQVRDDSWRDPLSYGERVSLWGAEQKLIQNKSHVVDRVYAHMGMTHRERQASLEKRSELAEAIDLITIAGNAQSTSAQYTDLAEEVARHPNLLYAEESERIMDGHGGIGESNGVAFFDVYAAQLDRDVMFSMFERMMRTFEKTKEAMAPNALIKIVKTVVLQWSGKQRVRAAEMIFKLFPKFRRVESAVHAILLCCDEDSVRDRALTFFVDEGLPIDLPMIKTWKQCSSREEGPNTFVREVDTIRSLEMERPGICTVLRKEFGIENYSRYPIELLLEQFDTRDDHSLPYGVVINPKTDYNSAFKGGLSPAGKGKDPLNDIYQQVKGKYRTRVYEAGSKLDVVRQLIKIKRRYIKPSGKKISYLLIGGHGDPGGIRFGEGGSIASINVQDLTGSGVASLGGAYFEPGATVILRSCSTGVESGIGQQLSQMLGLTMIAPKLSVNIKDITVTFAEDGKPIFTVTFHKGESMQYRAGVPMKQGEESIPIEH